MDYVTISQAINKITGIIGDIFIVGGAAAIVIILNAVFDAGANENDRQRPERTPWYEQFHF